MMIGEADIGPIPVTSLPINRVTMIDCGIYLLLLVMFMKVFMTMKEMIVGVAMKDGKLVLKIPDTLLFKITEKVLMVMVEVDIGLRPYSLPPITQVILLGCWVFMLMVKREVDICLRKSTIIHKHGGL